jgi:hypothetical protein
VHYDARLFQEKDAAGPAPPKQLFSLDLQCGGTGTVIARRQSRRGDPVQSAIYACIFCFWIASAFGLAMTEQALSWRLCAFAGMTVWKPCPAFSPIW